MSETTTRPGAPPEVAPLDLAEKGRRNGQEISLDRRLFMKFTAFGRCFDPHAAVKALAEDGAVGALYVDANDPQGIGVMIAAEDPEYFVTNLRALFSHRPFADYVHKHEFDMLGRSYSIGYEPDLEDTLLERPRRRLLDPNSKWAVWYPLQRAKRFQALPPEHQKKILAEHGTLAHRYGAGGHAADVRLACHGLDKNDNDFIIGLLGPKLHPLSAIVQEMRKTEQTSQYLDSLGPFFVGKTAWQGGK
ncbi:MAG TPA: chlorite dismutase family protein [Gammaproteobacteria bacterium]|nr:chlorite dismutase family protein [Gammaproteobacteria bacterium]